MFVGYGELFVLFVLVVTVVLVVLEFMEYSLSILLMLPELLVDLYN